MNRIKLVFILLVCIAFSSCEKDDICVDGDTALLIIRFYDVENPTEFKAVPTLRAAGVGSNFTVNTFADRSTLDSISIPLKTDDLQTSFIFIADSATNEDGNETGTRDQVTFSYETNEVFVSRACGFIINYDNLSTNFTTAAENWIQRIEIVKPLVKLETEETVETTAHVKVFH